MPIFVRSVITGGDELERKLLSLSRRVGRQAMRGPLRDATKAVKAKAVDTVPVDTGNLKEAMRRTPVQAGKKNRGSKIAMLYSLPRRELLHIEDPASKFYDPTGKHYYPAYVEYGVRSRGIAANPFLRTAFRDTEPEAIRIVTEGLKANIEAAIAGNGGSGAAP